MVNCDHVQVGSARPVLKKETLPQMAKNTVFWPDLHLRIAQLRLQPAQYQDLGLMAHLAWNLHR
jgi:hypothetical protein